MTKYIYVDLGKPLTFKEYEKSCHPTGWVRLDILKEKISTDLNYSEKFNTEELIQIRNK